MKLEAIQHALHAASIDGWLFCDFHHRDPMGSRILGLDESTMNSRRWFYWVPAHGEPIKLTHRVEPRALASLPGAQDHYLAWTELHEKLKGIVGGATTVAMQYSPMNDIPYVSVVDAGTVELIRSFGPEVVSSADLVQRFEAVFDDDGLASHRHAGDLVLGIKDEAYSLMDAALKESKPITEFEVMRFILSRFADEGLTPDDAVPIVGFNEHAADPHFEPTEENSRTLAYGDTILVDLWARRAEPPGVYYDITWCGFAGERPPDEYREIFDAARRARDAALEFIRDCFGQGRSCHGWEVDRVCRKVVQQAGYGAAFLHRTGHSIGTEVHGNGVNIDDLETRDRRLLVPGVCVSIEPGIYLEGRMGVRSEINVFIAPSGEVVVHGPMQHELLLIG